MEENERSADAARLRARVAELEQQLAEARGTYRALIDHLPQHVFLKDRGSVYLSANESYAKVLGTTTTEIVGRGDFEVYPRDLAEKYRADDRRVMDAGKVEELEERFVQDEEERWVHTIKVPVRDDTGAVTGVLGVFCDVTGHKLAERELLLKNNAFESAAAANSIADNNAVITHVNQAFVDLWGYETREAAMGNSVADFFVNPEDAAPVIQALGEKGQWQGDFLAQRQDGSHFMSRGFASVVRDAQGNQIGYQSANVDVTVELEVQAELQRTLKALETSNHELEQFAYVASHDLQEPLRMVSSYTQLLAERYQDQLDQDANDFIGFAVDGANRMQRLINDLLTYSRVNTRGGGPVAVDSHSALGRAIANLGLAIDEAGAMVTNDDLPRVMADEPQLVQVFQNLVGNAIKFRGSTPPRVHITAEAEGDEWRFAVRDNGIGIDAQYAERIFVIFQRLHGRVEYPGTGIGLALCKRIVERHGGRIWLESDPGKQTTFFFTLPAARS